MTAYYKLQNMTLADALDDLYRKYGYSLEKTTELIFDGYDGTEKMKDLMNRLRSPNIVQIADESISTVSDYLIGETKDLATERTTSTGLPASDVLRFGLKNGDVIIIRPSGTEPKVKIYYLLSAQNFEQAQCKLTKYINSVNILCK